MKAVLIRRWKFYCLVSSGKIMTQKRGKSMHRNEKLKDILRKYLNKT